MSDLHFLFRKPAWLEIGDRVEWRADRIHRGAVVKATRIIDEEQTVTPWPWQTVQIREDDGTMWWMANRWGDISKI